MNTHFFNLFFGFTTQINEYVANFWVLFFVSITSMDSWPTKNAFYNTFFSMNVYTFRRSNLMIRTSISNYINQSIISNIVYIPCNFVSMSLNNYLVRSIWINNPNRCSISISNKRINIRFYIIHPKFLTFSFKTSRRGIV